MIKTRFNNIKQAILLLSWFGCISFVGISQNKPNIVFIFADDQAFDAWGKYNDEVSTPNLDKLAEKGVVFTHAYNQGAWSAAVCRPSRTMLNTGRTIWNAYTVEDKLDSLADNKQFWSQLLADAGYNTYMTGKWHLKIKPERIFDHIAHERPGMPNQTEAGYHRPASPGDTSWTPWDTTFGGYWKGGIHWSEVVANDAERFLEHAAGQEAPFFMYLAFNAPHDPRQSPREYVDMYPLENIHVPAISLLLTRKFNTLFV